MIKKKEWKKQILISVFAILILLVLTLWFFILRDTGSGDIKVTGTDPVVNAEDILDATDEDCEVAIIKAMDIGITQEVDGSKEAGTKEYTWKVKPGQLMNYKNCHVIWPMEDIRNKAQRAQDQKRDIIVYVGVQALSPNELKAVVPVTIKYQEPENTGVSDGDNEDTEETNQVTTVTTGNDISVQQGYSINAPETPEREGYTFLGWFAQDQNGGWTKWDFNNNAVTNDITLTALWEVTSPQELTVTTYTTSETTPRDETVKVEKFTRILPGATVSSPKEKFARASAWDYGKSLAFSIVPVLIILLVIAIIRDINAISWYREQREEIMGKGGSV